MCKKRQVQRGMFVLSHIEGSRACHYRVGEKKSHSVKVTNLMAVDCWVGVTVTCAGDHIQAADGSGSWSEMELMLEPRQSATFSGDLHFVDSAGRRLPAPEDVEIAISWKDAKDDKLKPYFAFMHRVEVKPKSK